MSTGPQSLRLTLLNILFPQRCISCTTYGSFLCGACAIARSQPELLASATDSPNQTIRSLVTAGDYHVPEFGKAMEQYKFHAAKDLAALFAELLWRACEQVQPKWLATTDPVLIIPIPLHRKRIRERGFDQNLLLAQAFVRIAQQQGATHVCIAPQLVQRHKYTAHQTAVSASERHAHLHGAFTVAQSPHDSPEYQKSTLVLLDDIVTTGATFEQASSALTTAGFQTIHAIATLRAK